MICLKNQFKKGLQLEKNNIRAWGKGFLKFEYNDNFNLLFYTEKKRINSTYIFCLRLMQLLRQM